MFQFVSAELSVDGLITIVVLLSSMVAMLVLSGTIYGSRPCDGCRSQPIR